MSVTFQEFSRISWNTVARESNEETPFSSVLAIINSQRAEQLPIQFRDQNGIVSFCHSPGAPVGSCLTIGNERRYHKAAQISEAELEKVELRVGEVASCSISQCLGSYDAFLELKIDSDIFEKCTVPLVGPFLSLEGKKIVVLTNLQRECVHDQKVIVLCANNSEGYWQPFVVTDERISVGTRASL